MNAPSSWLSRLPWCCAWLLTACLPTAPPDPTVLAPPVPTAPYSCGNTPEGLEDLALHVTVEGPLLETEVRFVCADRHGWQLAAQLPYGAMPDDVGFTHDGDVMARAVVDPQMGPWHCVADPEADVQLAAESDTGNTLAITRNRSDFVDEVATDAPGVGLTLQWLQPRGVLGQRSTLPLAGTRANRIAVTTDVVGEASPTRTLPHAATQEVLIEVPQGQPDALRHGDRALVLVRAPEEPPLRFERAIVAIDTSASTGMHWATHVARLHDVLAWLSTQGVADIEVVAFDQQGERLPSPGASLDAALEARGPLGATDLGVGLATVLRVARMKEGPARVILLTDGLATLGDRTDETLQRRVRSLAEVGVTRLDVLATGRTWHLPRSMALAQAGLVQPGLVLAVQGRPGELDPLSRRVLPPVQVQVPHATALMPRETSTLVAGGAQLFAVDLPASLRLEVHVTGGLTGTQRPRVAQGTSVARFDRFYQRLDTTHDTAGALGSSADSLHLARPHWNFEESAPALLWRSPGRELRWPWQRSERRDLDASHAAVHAFGHDDLAWQRAQRGVQTPVVDRSRATIDSLRSAIREAMASADPPATEGLPPHGSHLDHAAFSLLANRLRDEGRMAEALRAYSSVLDADVPSIESNLEVYAWATRLGAAGHQLAHDARRAMETDQVTDQVTQAALLAQDFQLGQALVALTGGTDWQVPARDSVADTVEGQRIEAFLQQGGPLALTQVWPRWLGMHGLPRGSPTLVVRLVTGNRGGCLHVFDALHHRLEPPEAREAHVAREAPLFEGLQERPAHEACPSHEYVLTAPTGGSLHLVVELEHPRQEEVVGLLEVLRGDGRGGWQGEVRPFAMTTAWLDLGDIEGLP